MIALIGEELISDEPVAVVELVKNSYDADATKVDVRFEGETPERPTRIVVEDDGCGMSLRTVLGAWLEPATSSKRTADVSPGGRLYLGAKGIGRFAAARLAKRLKLETKRKNDKRGVKVALSWEDFDKLKYLDEIKIKYEVSAIPGLEHGTRLTMEPVEKEWKHEDYAKLHNRLSRLISPFKDIKGFVINLSIPWHPDLHGEVQAPELVSQPRYRLEGQLDDDGNFSGKMDFEGCLLKTFNKLKLGGRDAKPLCGGFEVELRVWDRDREGLEPLGEKLGLGIAEMRRTLNAFCGVTIYRDGFRVHPYGETGNDWARLDLRSRLTPGTKLANNQIIGSLKISRTRNPLLVDKSNREGMVLNAEHDALEKWLDLVLIVLEKERYDLRPHKQTPEGVQPLFEAFDLSPTVKEVRGQLGPRHPVTKLVSDAGENIKKGVERVQDAFSRLLMLSGLGQMVDIVIHEIGAPIGKIGRQLVTIEKEVGSIADPKVREKVMATLSPLRAWLDQVLLLRQRLDPQTPSKRGRATSFFVKDAVEDCFHLCEALLKNQGITTEIIEPDGPIRARMSRAVLDQILYNLADNAAFWISQEHGQERGGRIQVRVEKNAGGFKIVLCDDGTGVSQEDRTRIFEPYFTTKPNGMGLGLHVARLVIEPYGRLLLRDEGDLPGACFEAVFERNVGL